MARHIFTLAVALFCLTACSTSMTVEEFKDQEPRFVLEDYFTGKTKATGLFEDRFGNVRNQFTVDIDGSFDGTTLTLDENFLYNDGSTEFRRWEIDKTGPNSYVGRTEMAIGEAEGKTSGNSFHWTYKFRLTVGDDVWNVTFDDWMFLQKDGTLLNKATVYRWGFKIGTVFLSFRRADDAGSSSVGIAAE
ncbi:DUF3833 domain-containing protein [Kordiimonas lacus]|uniref:Lipoprotein n=1 Tax=Kordiimonas lacus TaxID=637679 RepID=A0A1G7AA44_9PROT|nr:DUF3833 domain-containing protein [Kordiimonas lacus]SDE10746.1 Protein of unknown function [Kordiimonas lacus]